MCVASRAGKGKLLLSGFAILMGLAISIQADEEKRHEGQQVVPKGEPRTIQQGPHTGAATGNARARSGVGPHEVAKGSKNGGAVGAHALPGTAGGPPGMVHEGGPIEQRTARPDRQPNATVPEAHDRERGELRRDARWEHHEFHEHNVRRLNHEELVLWRGGRWRNSCYGGRCGWWWFVDGLWYFYERPIYPYPPEVSLVTYVEPVEPAPVVEVPAAPVVQQPSVTTVVPQQQQAVWYFCASANAYYPYVSSCPTGWQIVPAMPASGNADAAAAAPQKQ
jgi:hypothetical protein